MSKVIEVKYQEGDFMCRGRNDWFRPAQVVVGSLSNQVYLLVRSKVQGHSDPIQIHLAPDEFILVADALRKTVREIRQDAAKETPEDSIGEPDQVFPFVTEAEASAFVEGVGFVNDSAVRVEQHGTSVWIYDEDHERENDADTKPKSDL
jgi:hypothetical protein